MLGPSLRMKKNESTPPPPPPVPSTVTFFSLINGFTSAASGIRTCATGVFLVRGQTCAAEVSLVRGQRRYQNKKKRISFSRTFLSQLS